jgi:hypothetical protein
MEKQKVFGKEDITDLSVKQLIVLVQNVQNAIEEERDFWIEAKDRIYLYWGKEVVK